MTGHFRRRRFLQSASALGLGAGLGSWSSLGLITPARAADLAVGPDAVRFRPEIEPVVRWIEETPREQVMETAIAQLKAGLSYRDLLSGLFLAGIRNVQPRPVGFKFHAVLVINSAHLLAQAAAPDERLLPLLWALDNFKNSQAQDVKEGDWTLSKVDESKVPGPDSAREAFHKAMDAWDVDGADVAAAGLCRSSGAAGTMEPFWRYAVRDQRDIGHKAIFASQCWRTLQAIGWQHAEPVLRSLAYGMLDLRGDDRPVAVGPYEANLEQAKKIRDGWEAGKLDPAATSGLLEVVRQATPEDASAEAANLLNKGVSPDSLWDAVVLAGSELMIRSPGIVSLHSVTAANSLHYIYNASGDDTTRKLALLQAVGWLPMYRGRANPQGGVRIDSIEAIEPEATGDESVGEIFAQVSKDRTKAAEKTVGYLNRGGSTDLIFAAGRRMIFHKGRDSHDYKYGAAAWEECRLAADPKWQPALAAAMMSHLPGAETPDSPLMNQAREAVSKVMG
ncbi:hypothetical protein P12x_000286 [Tundrisphaera lichenicola]|uniref:hypothetical protein n=1 Tax=Tundrisphaera lichenicola TaxID=2029860 RepID=UPI003EC05035